MSPFMTTTDWTVKRSMLFAAVVAAVSVCIALFLPSWVWIALVALCLISCCIPRFRHPLWLYTVVWAVAFLLIAGVYRAQSVEPVQRLAGETDTLTAQVVELPDSGHMVTAEVVNAEKLPDGTRVLLYCNEQVMPKLHDIVYAEVELKELYPTQQGHRADKVFLQAYPIAFDEEAMTVTSPPRSWRTVLSPLRERLHASIRQRLSGEEGALLAGICLGEKNSISQETISAFRRAGLAHILVVSGLHLSTISAAVYYLLRALLPNRRLAACLSMATVGFFMALIGFTPSVVRAGVMCLVMLGGQLFLRRADGLNSMGLALLLLLAANPYCLLDVGLQLSFGAAGGVLYLMSPLTKKLRTLPMPTFLVNGLAVTLAATLPILPLLAFYFGEVSVVSPLANLLAVFPAGVALTFGWVGILLALLPALSFFADGVLYLAGWSVRWPLIVARILGGLPIATLPTERAWTILYLTGGCGLVILCLCKVPRVRLRRLLAALAAGLMLARGADALLRCDTTTVTVSIRENSAVLWLEQDERYGLLVQDVAAIYTDDALVRACGGKLDFVAVGGGEPCDAAYLTELLRRVEVDRLLIHESAAFTSGLHLPIQPLEKDTTQTLWEGTTLSVDSEGKWLLSCRTTTLALAPERACAADAAIFVGQPPQESPHMTVGQGILLAEKDDAAAFVAAAKLPYPMTAITEEPLYLTTRGGEWSVSRWR